MKNADARFVLVLDDDPWHVSWIQDVAATYGFECEFASTYEEATAAFVKLSPSVLVVDIRIGDVDEPLVGRSLTSVDPAWVGLRFLRFVRVDQKNSLASVFVYTGLDREELQRVVENTYSSRFFTKFDADSFRSALDSELARVARR